MFASFYYLLIAVLLCLLITVFVAFSCFFMYDENNQYTQLTRQLWNAKYCPLSSDLQCNCSAEEPLCVCVCDWCIVPLRLCTYIQKILLHHCMEDDGDEEIEEDGGTVLPSIMVKCHLSLWAHTGGVKHTQHMFAVRGCVKHPGAL